MSRLNLTYPTALVLQALASGFHYGFDIMDATGLQAVERYRTLEAAIARRSPRLKPSGV